MNLREMTTNEVTDVIAVVAISLALFMTIWLEQKDLALMLGGALGGVVGMSTKNNK